MIQGISQFSRTSPRWGILLTAVAIPLAWGACATETIDTTEPTDQGNYTASIVDGTETTQLSGKAVYGTTQNSSGMTFNALYLWTGEPGGLTYDVIWFQTRNLDALEVGEYPIVDVEDGDPPLDDFLALYAFADDAAAATFHSVSGTLTITSAEFPELIGNFQIICSFAESEYHEGVVGDTVQVSGSFRAVPGTIY